MEGDEEDDDWETLRSTSKASCLDVTVWFLVGTAGMGYGDYYLGLI